MQKAFLLFTYLVCTLAANSQYNIAFRHITTQNGLSDNNVASAAIDRNGYLWISTTEGLNRYDGHTMEKYYREQYPALKNNSIREVVCDKYNRIWVRSFGGYIAMIDENKQWHSIQINDEGKPTNIYNIVNTKSKGIVLFNGGKQFISEKGNTEFHRWRYADDTAFQQRLYYDSYLSEDEVIWTSSNEFFIMNYALGKITLHKKIPGITSAAAANKNEIYITTAESGGLYKYIISTGQLVSLKNLRDQFQQSIFSQLQMVRRMPDGRLIITSAFAGIYIFDPQKNRLFRYVHDPLNRASISINNYNNLICDSSGYVLLISPTNGLSYFNVHDKRASQVPSVSNGAGFVYDGYINSIVKAGPEEFWMGGYNQLFLWNKRTGKASFVDYGKDAAGNPNRGNDEVLSLCTDEKNNLVIGTANNGVVIINKQGKLLAQIGVQQLTQILPSYRINGLLADGKNIYVSTEAGIALMHVSNYQLEALPAISALRQLNGIACGKLWKDHDNRIWIGTTREGAYCYNPVSNSLFRVGKQHDGTSEEVFSFAEDDKNQVYLGTMNGLVVLRNDSIYKTYNKQNALRADHCENIVKDNAGNIWFNNHNDIVRYKPSTGSFTFFDEKAGITQVGIRPSSCVTDNDGTFYFGAENGFTFFHPDSILQPVPALKLRVNSIEFNDSLTYLTSNTATELSTLQNNLLLHISAIDLDQSQNILYRYRLFGYDNEWITETNINSVRYNGLNPGKYKFQLKASADGQRWIDALSDVDLVIKPAFWQSWWFRFFAAFAVATIIFIGIKRREKLIHAKVEEKSRMEEMRSQALQYQLEIERVINYFATSVSRMHNVDEMLWDVVKTCIAQLGFEDCVIYMFNKEKTLLVQKAAYGPKNIDYSEVYNRVEIEAGSGIVGHVAQTGVAEIVDDTSYDHRYLVDDVHRYSEITIPLIGSEGVIGVIDSEHPEKNFYNNRHLQILTAIGNMVVNKIEQLEAVADSHNKEIEMARLQRDLATMQLTAMRAQMNPHFIFNALNSVQQYFLQGHTEEANKYLSRFSKLQREILNHCDKPFISLRKEANMLQLYLELEQLRFNGSFDFEVIVDEDIDEDEIKIPPMILQPFVENAIWHGLMPKKGHRHLSVEFKMEDDSDMLYCSVCDNGIGRKAAGEIKKNKPGQNEHESKGLSLVYRRLALLQEQMGRSFQCAFTDLEDNEGNATGTQVDVLMFTGY